MGVAYQREMSLVWRNLTAITKHVPKIKLKLYDAILKNVLVRPVNGAKENGRHVLRLVGTEQNKGKFKNLSLLPI